MCQRARVRHRRRKHLSDVGLGGRALFAVVCDRLTDCTGHRNGQIQTAAGWRSQHGSALCHRRVHRKHAGNHGLACVWYRGFFDTAVLPSFPTPNRWTSYRTFFSNFQWKASANGLPGGESLPVDSGAVWGTPGTNGQHSYFQLLHQGTSLIP